MKVSLWRLFATFFKIGALTFGGGYALIAVMQQEVVEKRHWATDADMLDMLVIAESTPGVIAVNTATSIGFRTRGVIGAVVATLGVVLPSFLIISALSFAIDALSANKWYRAAFAGVQVGALILVVNAFWKLFRQLDKIVFNYVLVLAAFALAVFTPVNVVWWILAGAVCGIVYSLVFPPKKQEALPVESVLDEKNDDSAKEDE